MEDAYATTIVDTITPLQPLYIENKEVDKFSFGQSDGWIVDSASTCHVSNKKEHFRTIEPTSSTVSGIGGDQGIKGRGLVVLITATTEPIVKKG
ncbi:hypothetical protein FS749_010061 [Ceratobasidium sp. UAMH 11750]|nr:hypothetical protein FS749_010061 [Ceratobasidium sp. UAMH 11750]